MTEVKYTKETKYPDPIVIWETKVERYQAATKYYRIVKIPDIESCRRYQKMMWRYDVETAGKDCMGESIWLRLNQDKAVKSMFIVEAFERQRNVSSSVFHYNDVQRICYEVLDKSFIDAPDDLIYY